MAEKTDGLTKEERDAVKQRAKELREQAKAGKNRAAGEQAVREAIDPLPADDKELAEGFVRVVSAVAPELMPRTYYGMPAFANGDGKVVVFMQPASKFKARYATIGFEDRANLDDGDMWPTAFAVRSWTSTVEERLTELVQRAVG
ncbi:iron chaperone [Agromyces aurantiacus]|uniref:Iron chaperone n=1 Tax=Agromyces aurantiacus TaxID=165814 RepID=A0ABV9R5F9_9MICO|nr:hypothetical protein [Agromyces aurantiacus]MBM7505872.1 uncharacterized protein YdhG (YjbR/CyaY superfamily) [Agromyces aurantiacus]